MEGCVMNVAYLIKDIRPHHTLLVPNEAVDQTALLKARTYLAFLQYKRVLKRESKQSWNRIYYNSTSTFAFDKMMFDDPNVVAVIPYIEYAERWDQPAVAIVKNNNESMELFNNRYLKSSMTWLNANKQILVALEKQFESRLVTA
jgi:hypothetical protein